ncbi:MAG: T9SS type A sorting domain-containing protein [Flammeovirgaceae bacterium]|nr:T9SS type A sorting domain-containing protein [Flammeovirgaceae bacterium]
MKIFFFFSFSIFTLCIHGQNASINPGKDELYREDEVTEVRITISDSDNILLHAEENRWLDIYVSADIVFSNSKLDKVKISNAGLRLRGNTARGHNKRSYKIDFKEFGGEKFESYKKINLKPNVNDPAHIRELISMHLYRLMNVLAPRVAPTVVYINEEFKGVYLNIEQIDDEFIDKRFDTEAGFLYKCAYSATLEDDGQINDLELYNVKMNEEIDTRSELNHFVGILNNSTDANFRTEIESVFGIDGFLRQMAVEAIIGHWDGYSYLNNNYYLYYNPDNSLFEFIAYDTDNTFGIDWVGRDWATRDLTHFYRHNQARPLSSRLLEVDEYRDRYYYYLGRLFDEYFTEAYLFPKFDFYKELLKPFVEKDIYFYDSFDFSYQDFLNAFEYESNKQAKYGLKDFVQTRRITGIPLIPKIALGQRSENEFNVYPNPTDGMLNIEMLDLKKVIILNFSGQEVFRSKESRIDISVLRKGTYIVRLEDQNGASVNAKLIKN